MDSIQSPPSISRYHHKDPDVPNRSMYRHMQIRHKMRILCDVQAVEAVMFGLTSTMENLCNGRFTCGSNKQPVPVLATIITDVMVRHSCLSSHLSNWSPRTPYDDVDVDPVLWRGLPRQK
jgi:hypothetical protein